MRRNSEQIVGVLALFILDASTNFTSLQCTFSLVFGNIFFNKRSSEIRCLLEFAYRNSKRE